MPGGDRTGPSGMGPMTGGGRGFCSAGSSRKLFGFGRGQGPRGIGGRGWRNWFHATGLTQRQRFAGQVRSREEEAGLLKNQAEILTRQLEDVQKRISELESTKEK